MIGDVEVRDTQQRGFGVFARRAFAPGQFIFRRTHIPIAGPAIDQLPADQRDHVCQLDLHRLAIVAPPGCFMNHSCAPNALRRGVKVVAWRAIGAGDEITLDYRLNAVDGSPWKCQCGAHACTGVVEGGFFALDPRRQRQLLPFAGAHVQQEHQRRTAP